MIPRVKGTHDWLELELFNFVIARARHHLKLYNFTEIATPLIESVELFKRSLGQHTDVVSKEMFLIVPRNEDDQLCLRPEATASVVRAFIENNVEHTPWKVFTWGPMFRYERPQKGRYRQFHQLSLEIIGSHAIAQDAQCITMLDRFFHEQLSLSNYALALNFLGCVSDRVTYKERLLAFLNAAGADALCAQCLERKDKNILRIFDCKNPACQKLYTKAPHTAEVLCQSCAQEWQTLKDELEQLSVSFTYSPTLVRGLDYYTKTVFEFVSTDLGAQNAFCGGGRYDHLAKNLGAREDQPGIGAAIGLERVLIALEASRNTLSVPQQPALHVIIPLTVQQQSLALLLADMLRAHNVAVDVLVEGASLKAMMRQANRIGAAFCLLLGEKEQQEMNVTVKNMVTGQEQSVAHLQLVDFLKR